MLKIAICDDEPIFCRQLKQYITSSVIHDIAEFEIDLFHDPDEFLKQSETVSYKLIFMDLSFKHEIAGIRAAKIFRENNLFSEIVFVSSYDHYALQLFEVSPYQFLMKPITEEQVRQLMLHFLNKYSDYKSFRYKNRVFPFSIYDITHFEYNNRYVMIYGSDHEHPIDQFRIYDSFAQFCKEMAAYHFVQVQQHICLNLNRISSYELQQVTLSDNYTVHITSTYLSHFLKEYMRYHKW